MTVDGVGTASGLGGTRQSGSAGNRQGG